jgi:hypothetical protein
LARGDVLLAYDEAMRAVDANPDDLDGRYLAALALARAGARDGARRAVGDLQARIDVSTAGVDPQLREDAEALVARWAKDEALEASGDRRRSLLRDAARRYEIVADRFERHFSCVNAATLYLLAGDVDRAHTLANRALRLVDADRDSGYWSEATRAEAALVLGDVARARHALERAAATAGEDFAALAVTRRQLRLVCDANRIDAAILDGLAAPLIVHYCGHRIDDDAATRFPAELEATVASQIRDFVASQPILYGYGSLASGADILTAEALLERGAHLHVVLPCAADDFDRVSVAPAGREWSERFRSCLEQASSVVYASDSSFDDDADLFGYAGRIAMGHALNRASNLDAPVEQIAVWDRAEGDGVAGTAHDVAVWRRTGNPTHVIPLPDRGRAVQPQPTRAALREIGAILFTDFHGFSRLRDEHFPVFVNEVFAALGAVLDARERDVLWRNSWGDAIAAVFGDVTAAADCALALHDTLATFDLPSVGLPPDLHMRIGAHAGPVIAFDDPIAHRRTYWGRELTRAARIEPRTPEGEVYVTDAFAALLALEPDTPFTTDYVGRITTAKDFETIPMYRLRRRRVAS